MTVNSLPKTVTRQRHGYDLNPGPSAPESSTLTTQLIGQSEECVVTHIEWGYYEYPCRKVLPAVSEP